MAATVRRSRQIRRRSASLPPPYRALTSAASPSRPPPAPGCRSDTAAAPRTSVPYSSTGVVTDNRRRHLHHRRQSVRQHPLCPGTAGDPESLPVIFDPRPDHHFRPGTPTEPVRHWPPSRPPPAPACRSATAAQPRRSARSIGSTGLVTALSIGDCTVAATAGRPQCSAHSDHNGFGQPRTGDRPRCADRRYALLPATHPIPSSSVSARRSAAAVPSPAIPSLAWPSPAIRQPASQQAAPRHRLPSPARPPARVTPSPCSPPTPSATVLPSALADVITTYNVIETFYEPDTQPNDSIFIGIVHLQFHDRHGIESSRHPERIHDRWCDWLPE